jgi:hypothetical protein
MRIFLTIALLAAACGSKKPPQAPAAPVEQKSESDLRDENKPDDADDETPKSADDPCDGGE